MHCSDLETTTIDSVTDFQEPCKKPLPLYVALGFMQF